MLDECWTLLDQSEPSTGRSAIHVDMPVTNEHRNIYIKGILQFTSLRTYLLSIRYLTKIGNKVTFSGNSVKVTGSEKELRLDKEENRDYTLEARLRNDNKSQLSSEKVVF